MDFKSPPPPMLDYVTKLMLLEMVSATVNRDIESIRWIDHQLTILHRRWSELDGK